ncbi:MAG: flavin reductase family protein [Actinomycetota bacterium]|nr:flavin reductase family protein [Actinomycetota bacterium]
MTTQPVVGIPDLLRYGTSTVGLITTVGSRGVNMMAAEWTYLVARQPPHFAVGCQLTNHSTDLIVERGEFGLTLCDASMTGLADFAGSFSGVDVDKSAVSGVTLRDPVVLGTPVVDGGTLRAECRVVHVVELPAYRLIIGEAVWLEADERANQDPLVKHGGMYRLGERVRAATVTASATRLPDGDVRVCATAQGAEADKVPWTVSLGDDTPVATSHAGTDLDVVLTLPRPPEPGETLVVARPGYSCARVRLPLLSAEP